MAAKEGIDLPGEMQTLFEDGQLVEASARAQAERNAMVSIAGAAAAQTSESDPLTVIGMVGENPGAALVAARAALEAGDLDATLAAADDAYRGWAGAWQEGRRRTLLLIAVIATIVVLASAVTGRIRGARASAGAGAGAGSAGTRMPPAAAAVLPLDDEPDPRGASCGFRAPAPGHRCDASGRPHRRPCLTRARHASSLSMHLTSRTTCATMAPACHVPT